MRLQIVIYEVYLSIYGHVCGHDLLFEFGIPAVLISRRALDHLQASIPQEIHSEGKTRQT